jgi:glucokinase
MKDEIAIGIDLGGMSVRVGAIDQQGTLLAVHDALIEAARGPEAGLARISALIEQVLTETDARLLVGIGIGSTGPVDPVLGVINNPYTLPGWKEVPITRWLRKYYDVPITLENDADAAALGEYWRGAGQSVRRLYAITVGTGIGVSLILDGHIYRGLNNAHPDGGHMIVDPSGPPCYCGAHGCWESLCSGPAIARRAREADLSSSMILEMAGGNIDKIDARLVAEAARAGDRLACSIMEKVADYFAIGVVNVITCFVPDMIVLGGGVMKSSDLFLPRLQTAITDHSVMVPATSVKIELARLGNHAGIYGAAYSIWSQREE